MLKSDNNKKKCPTGKILRDAYTRKSYTRANGTKVKSKKVKAACIKDVGKPGKGKKLIGNMKKGLLGRYGYHDVKKLTLLTRKRRLTNAVKNSSWRKVFHELNAIYVLNKNKSPSLAKKFKIDRDWVEQKYRPKLTKVANRKTKTKKTTTKRKTKK